MSRRDPSKWETRACARELCDNTFETRKTGNKHYCSSTCRYSDPLVRSRISHSVSKHKVSDVDESTMTATCSMCGPGVKIFDRRGTRIDDASVYRCWLGSRAWHWSKRYGVSVDDVAALLKIQGNRCGICRRVFSESFCVDHDHVTNAVRGLLCSNCNGGLGLLGDTVEAVQAALTYLNQV